MALPLVFTSAAMTCGDCFCGSITLRPIFIAYENAPAVRSNGRRRGRGNCFDLGPNPECVARGNGFASANGGIAKSKRDCNGEGHTLQRLQLRVARRPRVRRREERVAQPGRR